MFTFPPVNFFPELLNLAIFAPALLRLFLVVVFVIWLKDSLVSLRELYGKKDRTERIINVAVVFLGIISLAIGFYTQIGAILLLGVLLYQLASRGRALKSPAISGRDQKILLLAIIVILVSILITGAGPYSIDLPL